MDAKWYPRVIWNPNWPAEGDVAEVNWCENEDLNIAVNVNRLGGVTMNMPAFNTDTAGMLRLRAGLGMLYETMMEAHANWVEAYASELPVANAG